MLNMVFLNVTVRHAAVGCIGRMWCQPCISFSGATASRSASKLAKNVCFVKKNWFPATFSVSAASLTRSASLLSSRRASVGGFGADWIFEGILFCQQHRRQSSVLKKCIHDYRKSYQFAHCYHQHQAYYNSRGRQLWCNRQLGPSHLNRLSGCNSLRTLMWKATGKRVTTEEVTALLRSPKFMANMTDIQPGPENIRVCPLPVEADKELPYPRTVFETIQNAATKNKIGACMTATGNICGWVDPVTEDLRFLPYDQFFAEAKQISMAFRELGIQAKEFSAISWLNSKEFLELMYGTTSMSMALQPLYPNLDTKAVKYVLKQGEAKVFFCDTEAKARLVVDNASSLPFLKNVIVGTGRPGRDLITDARSVGIQLLGLNDFRNLGDGKHHELFPPKPDDIFTLVYTSGTTGNPKGAIVTHESIMRAYHIISSSVGPLRARAGEFTFCYMPTGHIYEILFELLVLSEGGTAMFWRGDIKKMVEDMQIIRPHYIPMVPRIMNKIYDGVQEKLATSKVKRAVFSFCYNRKKKLLQKGILRNDTIFDKLVFKKIHAILGGRVNSIISSSAPLSAEVMEFFKVVFGCPISEVYGSTETLAICGTSPYDCLAGHLGGPFPSVEIKLIDVPELGYYARDNVGEICVRSPLTFKGYYKDEEATANAIVDGWVVTGDVGRWTNRGTLIIIDRKKDIFKLSQGEYIAPEKIESVYGRIETIVNIFVDGRSDQRFCVAVVVPDETLFRALAQKIGIGESSLSLKTLCENIQLRKAFLSEMRNFGAAHDLSNLHQARNICFEMEPFTVENGLLTSTLKLKRNVARELFSSKVDELYREGSLVGKDA